MTAIQGVDIQGGKQEVVTVFAFIKDLAEDYPTVNMKNLIDFYQRRFLLIMGWELNAYDTFWSNMDTNEKDTSKFRIQV